MKSAIARGSYDADFVIEESAASEGCGSYAACDSKDDDVAHAVKGLR